MTSSHRISEPTLSVHCQTNEMEVWSKKKDGLFDRLSKYLFKNILLLLHQFFVEAHHPVDAELIGKHSEVIAPEGTGHWHGYRATG